MTKHRQSIVWAAVVGLALVLGNWAGMLQGQSAPVVGPAKIAVADVQKIFQSLDERGAIEADITAKAEKLQQEEQDKRGEIRQLQTDLEILSSQSEAFSQTQDKLEKKAIELKNWKDFQQQKLEREKAAQMAGLYRKTVDGIKRVAERNGYDLVLYEDQDADLKGQNQQQIVTQIQLHKVLYAASHLQITDQVTQLLNNEYNNR